MKKIMMVASILVACLFSINTVKADDTVTLYMFRGNGCGYCAKGITYLYENADLFEGVNIVTYEIWYDDVNSSLMSSVAEALGIDTSSDSFGVPFFVVGESYYNGFGDSTGEKLLAMIEEYTSGEAEYVDVVAEVIEENGYDAEATTVAEVYAEENEEDEEESSSEANSTVEIIVYCVFGVIIIGIIGLIVFSRR